MRPKNPCQKLHDELNLSLIPSVFYRSMSDLWPLDVAILTEETAKGPGIHFSH